MSAARPVLSLADLEAFDPHAPAGGTRQRLCCPICGHTKPIDAEHRSFSLKKDEGLWKCHRCGHKGRLQEHWEERPRSRRDRSRAALLRATALPTAPKPAAPTSAVEVSDWRERWESACPLAGTPGADYLTRREIPLDLAYAAEVRFCADWYGRPAILFPIRNHEGRLAAVEGRHIDGRGKPKTRAYGDKRQGVFATPDALEAELFILAEGPTNALSLAACGFPAVAMMGCNPPEWLLWACFRRRVIVATDADEAGDKAARKLLSHIGSRGAASVTRLRPPDGLDWNDLLQDADQLREYLLTELHQVPAVLVSVPAPLLQPRGPELPPTDAPAPDGTPAALLSPVTAEPHAPSTRSCAICWRSQPLDHLERVTESVGTWWRCCGEEEASCARAAQGQEATR